MHRPIGPIAYDCVKVIIVRDGSALLFSEFGQRIVTAGDVVVLGANVLCGSEPEGHITATTIYLDTDYVIDQVFWQHAWLLHDRLDAQRFTKALYSEPSQVLRLGEDRTDCRVSSGLIRGLAPLLQDAWRLVLGPRQVIVENVLGPLSTTKYAHRGKEQPEMFTVPSWWPEDVASWRLSTFFRKLNTAAQ